MELIKTVSKGYTIIIQSSEGDYDNIENNSITFSDKENVRLLVKILEDLFKISSPSYDDVKKWVEKNSEIKKFAPIDWLNNESEWCLDFVTELLGGHESNNDEIRKFEKAEIFYNSTDVYSYKVTEIESFTPPNNE